MPNYMTKKESRQNQSIKLTNQAIRSYLDNLMFLNVVLINSIDTQTRTFKGRIIPRKLRQKVQLDEDDALLKINKTEQNQFGSSTSDSFVTMTREEILVSGIVPVGFKIYTGNKEKLDNDEISPGRSIVLCAFLDIDFVPLFQKWTKTPSSMPKINGQITDESNENFHSKGSAVIVLKVIDLVV